MRARYKAFILSLLVPLGLGAQEIGLPVVWIPMVMIVMSTVYSVASYPAGLLGARERAESVSARFEVESAPGKGTTLRVTSAIPPTASNS